MESAGPSYDACTFAVKHAAVLIDGAVVPARLRSRHPLFAAQVQLSCAICQVVGSEEVVNAHALLQTWGVETKDVETFEKATLILALPHLIVALAKRASWSTVMMRASDVNRWRLPPGILQRFRHIDYPPQRWLESLRLRNLFNQKVPEENVHMPLTGVAAASAADLLRQQASSIIAKAPLQERDEIELHLQQLVAQLDCCFQDSCVFGARQELQKQRRLRAQGDRGH